MIDLIKQFKDIYNEVKVIFSRLNLKDTIWFLMIWLLLSYFLYHLIKFINIVPNKYWNIYLLFFSLISWFSFLIILIIIINIKRTSKYKWKTVIVINEILLYDSIDKIINKYKKLFSWIKNKNIDFPVIGKWLIFTKITDLLFYKKSYKIDTILSINVDNKKEEFNISILSDNGNIRYIFNKMKSNNMSNNWFESFIYILIISLIVLNNKSIKPNLIKKVVDSKDNIKFIFQHIKSIESLTLFLYIINVYGNELDIKTKLLINKLENIFIINISRYIIPYMNFTLDKKNFDQFYWQWNFINLFSRVYQQTLLLLYITDKNNKDYYIDIFSKLFKKIINNYLLDNYSNENSIINVLSKAILYWMIIEFNMYKTKKLLKLVRLIFKENNITYTTVYDKNFWVMKSTLLLEYISLLIIFNKENEFKELIDSKQCFIGTLSEEKLNYFLNINLFKELT